MTETLYMIAFDYIGVPKKVASECMCLIKVISTVHASVFLRACLHNV